MSLNKKNWEELPEYKKKDFKKLLGKMVNTHLLLVVCTIITVLSFYWYKTGEGNWWLFLVIINFITILLNINNYNNLRGQKQKFIKDNDL